MSASQPRTRVDLAAGDSFLPAWIKDGVRALLTPVVRFALAAHVTPNTITVVGLAVVSVAALLIAQGWLLAGAAVLIAGSLLDAVDGALARATGGTTAFGGFLDSTLDRVAEAVLFIGIAVHYASRSPEPILPVVAALFALSGSFLVSYTRARAEGLGYAASIGVAPRPERLVLLSAGLILTGLGVEAGLIGAMWVVVALTTATVLQRIWHVWRQSGSPPQIPDTARTTFTAEENRQGG